MNLVLKVEGMACMNCANKVEKALKACDGVEDVNIVLETGMVMLKTKDDVSACVLVDAVNDTGFEASLVE